MTITPEKFLELLGQSSISLETKKEILSKLKNYTDSEIEYVYKLLDTNVRDLKRIQKTYRRKTRLIDLKYESKIKSEIKRLRELELKGELEKELHRIKKKKNDEYLGSIDKAA